MNLDKLFPPVEFTTAELFEIAQALNKPAVKKYLKREQAVALKAIGNGLPKSGQSDIEYLRQQALVVGALEVFEKLLDIEDPSTSTNQ